MSTCPLGLAARPRAATTANEARRWAPSKPLRVQSKFRSDGKPLFGRSIGGALDSSLDALDVSLDALDRFRPWSTRSGNDSPASPQRMRRKSFHMGDVAGPIHEVRRKSFNVASQDDYAELRCFQDDYAELRCFQDDRAESRCSQDDRAESRCLQDDRAESRCSQEDRAESRCSQDDRAESRRSQDACAECRSLEDSTKQMAYRNSEELVAWKAREEEWMSEAEAREATIAELAASRTYWRSKAEAKRAEPVEPTLMRVEALERELLNSRLAMEEREVQLDREQAELRRRGQEIQEADAMLDRKRQSILLLQERSMQLSDGLKAFVESANVFQVDLGTDWEGKAEAAVIRQKAKLSEPFQLASSIAEADARNDDEDISEPEWSPIRGARAARR